MRSRVARGLTVAPLLFTAACFTTTGLNRYSPNLYSIDQEIGMGREFSKEVEKEVALVRHRGMQEVVQTIGQRCVEHASHPEFKLYPYTFKVVDSSEINAFSLPGGPVYLNTGMIELAESEDELAGVIAHEMSHVALRHATKQMTTQQLSQVAILIALSTIGGAPALAVEGGRLAYILSVLRYSRSMESEADALGFELMEEAGYDPRAMVTMLRRLDEERKAEPFLLERLTSSHPLPDDRIAAIETKLSREHPTAEAAKESPTFARVKVLFAKD